jgi:chorismate synthase
MFRYLTAGESHGPALTAIVEGVPAGLPLASARIDSDLARRQQGYGRGGRMKIETDQVQFLSGVRWGETLGSPITLSVTNRDWTNWAEKMSVRSEDRDDSIRVTRPRPGHADLAGAMKYAHRDVRNVLERSSARETAVRVAVGGVAKALLSEVGIAVHGFVVQLGGIDVSRPDLPVEELVRCAATSELFTWDPDADGAMKRHIDAMKEAGDSVGGVVEVVATGVPVGLGSHVQWDRKLDARLAMALMSIQAIKGVEFGLGFAAAATPGSRVHDEICRAETGTALRFGRRSNRAGGIEGGISNGEHIVVRAAMKPIPTLYKPLETVDLESGDVVAATVERSDVCAVPAAAVVAEAVVAIELARALLEKFGGDSVSELRRSHAAWMEQIRAF